MKIKFWFESRGYDQGRRFRILSIEYGKYYSGCIYEKNLDVSLYLKWYSFEKAHASWRLRLLGVELHYIGEL